MYTVSADLSIVELGINGIDTVVDTIRSTDVVSIKGKHNVPAQNLTDNDIVSQVVGNKTDALIDVVGTTKSNIAYLKGLVQFNKQNAVPHLVYIESATGGYHDVVNVSDKGFLISITNWTTVNGGHSKIKITIDGNVKLEEYLTKGAGMNDNPTCIPCFLKFNTSLRIEHYGYSSGLPNTIVSYTTD